MSKAFYFAGVLKVLSLQKVRKRLERKCMYQYYQFGIRRNV